MERFRSIGRDLLFVLSELWSSLPGVRPEEMVREDGHIPIRINFFIAVSISSFIKNEMLNLILQFTEPKCLNL